MSRYVLVSIDASDKVIKLGPLLWDGARPIELPADTCTMLESDAVLAGYIFPGLSLVEANTTTLQSKATTALAANVTFQAIVSPTNAQILAQVQLLTRENNTIIRLLLNLTDTTSGT